jgi:uncharacterized integral membrane protein
MEGSPGQRRERGAKFWLFVIAAALAIVFIVLNSKQVDINFIVATVNTSLVVALLVATLLGMIVGWLAARLRAGGRND